MRFFIRGAAAAVAGTGLLVSGLSTAAMAAGQTCSAGSAGELGSCFATVNSNGSGTVKLTGDVTVTDSTLAVGSGAWLTLDLAGHSLTATAASIRTNYTNYGEDGTNAGIAVPSSAILTVTSSAAGGHLTATGGSIDTTAAEHEDINAGTGAGIGTAGGDQYDSSDASGMIFVNGGTVTASGGSIADTDGTGVSNSGGAGAGIGTGGAGYEGSSGVAAPISINGGTVVAQGGAIGSTVGYSRGSSGAGIGTGGMNIDGGSAGSYGTIHVASAAHVTATAGVYAPGGGYGNVGADEGSGGGNYMNAQVGSPTGHNAVLFVAKGVSVRPVESTPTVAEPTAPTRAGFTFTGWFTSASVQDESTAFDFAASVADYTTLYAGWTADQAGSAALTAWPRQVSDTSVESSCGLSAGVVESCAVDAWMTIGGKSVKVGSATVAGDGSSSSVPVMVPLNAAGRAAVKRIGGAGVTLKASVTQDSVEAPTTATASTTVLPTKVEVATVLFDVKGSTISPAARKQLKAIAKKLDATANVTCTGYTQNGSDHAYRLKLSKTRADKVCAILKSGDAGSYATAAKGIADPASSGHSAAAKAKNRRVVVTVEYRQLT